MWFLTTIRIRRMWGLKCFLKKVDRSKWTNNMALFLLECKEDDERQDDFLLKNPLLQFRNDGQFCWRYHYSGNLMVIITLLRFLCKFLGFLLWQFIHRHVYIVSFLESMINRLTVYKPVNWKLQVKRLTWINIVCIY